MSDTLMIEATGMDKDRLVAVLRLCPRQNVYGIKQVENTLVMQGNADGLNLGFKAEVLADAIMDWLARSPGSDPSYQAPTFPPEPNIDGDCKRGWKVVGTMDKTEIHPFWMVFHKWPRHPTGEQQ